MLGNLTFWTNWYDLWNWFIIFTCFLCLFKSQNKVLDIQNSFNFNFQVQKKKKSILIDITTLYKDKMTNYFYCNNLKTHMFNKTKYFQSLNTICKGTFEKPIKQPQPKIF